MYKRQAYGTIDMDTVKVNTKDVSLQLIFGDEENGTVVKTTGENTNDLAGFIRLAKGESLPLPYNAEVPVSYTHLFQIPVFPDKFSMVYFHL